jgi:hypothetical protein
MSISRWISSISTAVCIIVTTVTLADAGSANNSTGALRTSAPRYAASGAGGSDDGGTSADDGLVQVPEPTSMALFALALFGVAMLSRRRKPQREQQ